MRSIGVLPILILALPTGLAAQTPGSSGRGIYDRCLLQAAIAVSHDEVSSDSILALARKRCAPIRSPKINGQGPAPFDTADAVQAARFPDWMDRLRERRRLRNVGLPIPADPGYP